MKAMPKILEILGKKGTWEILEEIRKHKRVSYTQLQKLTKLNSRTLSRRLKNLVENNIIKRIVHDDRTVHYTLTEKSRKMIDKLTNLLDEFENEVMKRR